MKYKYVHIENGPRCFLYASQFQQCRDTSIFFCMRMNPEFKQKFHYKMYKLFNNELNGPVFVDSGTDLRLIGLTDEYSKLINNAFESALKIKNENNELPYSDVEKPKYIHKIQDDNNSGQQLIAENNQKPDRASPNLSTENSYSKAITHFYSALNDRDKNSDYLAISDNNTASDNKISLNQGAKR